MERNSRGGPSLEETLETKVDRRDFLKKAGMTVAAGGLLTTIGACGSGESEATTTHGTSGPATTAGVATDTAQEAVEVVMTQGGPEVEWEMGTSWPLSLDTIYGGAVDFAQRVSDMTGGRFTITPRAAGELVPGLEVLQNVQQKAIPAGHTASYYYVGLSPATAFNTALPFGFTYRQQNAWMYEGGGLQLMQDFYADRFGVINFPAGNTGVQMGGWFNKEINSTADLQGLRMRIPGLGGKVMERLGVTVQVLPGGEIFQALQTGAIDATEWVGPYDDTTMGFHDVSTYYYYPGWWEPGPELDVFIPLDEWNQLPEEYQAIVEAAAYSANATMMARYDAKNPAALQTVLESGIELRPFPEDVMQASQDAAFELFDETAVENDDFRTIFGHWSAFRDGITRWHGLAETAMVSWTGRN